jgi:hypothetical protein
MQVRRSAGLQVSEAGPTLGADGHVFGRQHLVCQPVQIVGLGAVCNMHQCGDVQLQSLAPQYTVANSTSPSCVLWAACTGTAMREVHM